MSFDGSTLSCSDTAKDSPSDTGCQHLLRPLKKKKTGRSWLLALLVGNWDVTIEEYISAPYRLVQARRKPQPTLLLTFTRITVDRCEVTYPRRQDVAGDRKGDCTRCRLSVTEVKTCRGFFFFLVRSGMQRVLPQPKKKACQDSR